MTVQEFVDQIKRDCQVGTPGDNSDQAAIDIISKMNRKAFRIWRAWDWEWSIVALEFTVPANDPDVTLGATVGSIICIGLQGKKGYLKRFTPKRYREWEKKLDTSTTGEIHGYLRRGRDSSGNIKLRFFHTPSAATVIEGEGKTRFVALTTSDIAATAIAYFPEEYHDLLYEMVKGAVLEAEKDERGPGISARAEAMLKAAIQEDEADPADEVEAPPPDYIKHKVRTRGGTTVT